MINIIPILLLFLPLFFGLFLFFWPRKRTHFKKILFTIPAIVSVTHFIILYYFSFYLETSHLFFTNSLNDLLAFPVDSEILLLLNSLIFIMISLYLRSYLSSHHEFNGFRFCGIFLLYLGGITFALFANNLLVFWASIELLTLLSAPLIFSFKSGRSLEATWKYLIVCSFGMVFALLGNFFLVNALSPMGDKIPFTFGSLINLQGHVLIVKPMLSLSMIFIFIGNTTKLGIAPMHSWVPDVYSEAPAPVSALLCTLSSIVVLGLYRYLAIFTSLDSSSLFMNRLFIYFGIFSVVVATCFMISQKDYRRFLSYSSIENYGLILVALGIGSFATFGAFLHLIYHSLIKVTLFLGSTHLYHLFKTRDLRKHGELLYLSPKLFLILSLSFVTLMALPPFGIFFSKILIFFVAFKFSASLTGGNILFCLLTIFSLLASIILLNTFIQISFKKRKEVIYKGFQHISMPQKWPLYLLLMVTFLISFYLPLSFYEKIPGFDLTTSELPFPVNIYDFFLKDKGEELMTVLTNYWSKQ